MESFNFPVGLRPIWADPFVGSADGVEDCGELVAAGVDECVVGHHPVDPVSETGEPCCCSEHEPGSGFGVVSVEDFGVGNPAVVVDHRVTELIADGLFGSSILHSDRPPAAAVRHTSQLLDVDMNQLTGTVFDISDWDTGGSVEVTQPVQASTFQHGVDRRPGHAETAGHQMRTLPFSYPISNNGLLGLFCKSGGTPMRTRRPVDQTSLTFRPPPTQPLVSRLAGHPHRFGSMSHRPTLHFDPVHQ